MPRENATAESRAPYCRQFIAITPRSGSMWWCDMLGRAGLGKPFELLNEQQAFRRQHFLHRCPATWSEVHRALSEAAKTDAYDLKTSWFQFEFLLGPSLRSSLLTEGFPRAVWSYLTRDDIVAQAMSLYLMRRLGSSHARRGEEPAEISASWLEPTQANFSAVMCWLLHIAQQEYAWERFFREFGLEPWRCTYEDIAARPAFHALQYFRHATRNGMGEAARIPRPFITARRAVRQSPLVKRAYRGPSTEAFVAAFRQSFGDALSILPSHRGHEDALALRKKCGLRDLDESELLGP